MKTEKFDMGQLLKDLFQLQYYLVWVLGVHCFKMCYIKMNIGYRLERLIEWVKFYVLCQHGISHVKHPCNGTGIGCLWLLLLKSTTGGDMMYGWHRHTWWHFNWYFVGGKYKILTLILIPSSHLQGGHRRNHNMKIARANVPFQKPKC